MKPNIVLALLTLGFLFVYEEKQSKGKKKKDTMDPSEKRTLWKENSPYNHSQPSENSPENSQQFYVQYMAQKQSFTKIKKKGITVVKVGGNKCMYNHLQLDQSLAIFWNKSQPTKLHVGQDLKPSP